MRARGSLAAFVAGAALLLAACPEAANPQRQAEARDDGVQATGQLLGQRVAISDGEPGVVLGDCGADGHTDLDLCIATRTVDGEPIRLVFVNAGVLREGVRTEVRGSGCRGAACEAVTGHAVVELQVGGRALRASGGQVVLTTTGPRYAGELRLRLPGGGRLTATFNVRPVVTG